MNNQSIYEDGTYLERNSDWHQGDSSWKAGKIRDILNKNKVSCREIGEAGCGAGGVLREMSKFFDRTANFTGYDISPQAIELTHAKVCDNVHYQLGDILHAGIQFDLVLAIDVFEHVENYIDFVRSLRAIGTYKVFHIPLDLSAQSVLRKGPLLANREWLGHLHYFTKDTALATLQYAGYDIIDWNYTNWCFELPDSRLESKLMWLPRKLFFSLNNDFAVRLLGGFSLLVLAK